MDIATRLCRHINALRVSQSSSSSLTVNRELFKFICQHSSEPKRSPEVFSESLYPLQSGKQQLEAMLDRTLDITNDGKEFVEESSEIGRDRNDFVENRDSSMSKHKQTTVKEIETTQTTPGIHTSGYLDAEKGPADVVNDSSAVDEYQRISKKWWAAEALKHFRSPKSSRPGHFGRRRHIDPVFYFIGLGK